MGLLTALATIWFVGESTPQRDACLVGHDEFITQENRGHRLNVRHSETKCFSILPSDSLYNIPRTITRKQVISAGSYEIAFKVISTVRNCKKYPNFRKFGKIPCTLPTVLWVSRNLQRMIYFSTQVIYFVAVWIFFSRDERLFWSRSPFSFYWILRTHGRTMEGNQIKIYAHIYVHGRSSWTVFLCLRMEYALQHQHQRRHKHVVTEYCCETDDRRKAQLIQHTNNTLNPVSISSQMSY